MTKALLAVAAACASSVALAQTAASNFTDTAEGPLETVIVTGSHIRRTESETSSPLQVITSEEIHASGLTSVQDLLHNLTANGQGTLSQGFSGAFAAGASGIALRGLNVGATLVLIDGHRMAPYPIGDDGQRSFVDISNIPYEAVERLEVLKDGASAIYGSDAIAGVVNIILKKDFAGAQINADTGISSRADGNLYHVSGIWGIGDLANDGHNFYVSAEYRTQKQIRVSDRGYDLNRTDYTADGGIDATLGAQNILVGGLPRSGTGYVTDADGNIVGFMPGCDATLFAADKCTYHDIWSQIQPRTTNYNFVAKFTQNLGDWQAALQGSYFESKAQQVAPPSRAFAAGYQGVALGPNTPPTLLDPIDPTTIPSTNPSFPKGTGLDSGFLRYTFQNLGPNITNTDSKSTRAILDVNGKAAGFDVEISAGFTEVELYIDGLNYVNPLNVQTALNRTTDPLLIGQPNSAQVNAFIAPDLHTGDTSKLSFGHAGVSRSLLPLPGGDLAVAFGADYFQRNQHATAPPLVEAGYYTRAFSNNFTVGLQQVASGYLELSAPFIKQFQMDAAVRYDHYNLSGGKASPKVGFKFTPVPEIALRGTASKGFRAPGPAENGTSGQAFFAGASVDPILCPNPGNVSAPGNFVGQCSVPVATLQSTNSKLKPETSTAYTLGLVYEPFQDVSATLDLWSIKLDNQILPGGASVTVRGNNLTPIPQFQPDGTTALVAPPVAPITYFTTSFINANSTKTDGLDLGIRYRHKFDGIGQWKSEANWSFTHRYDVTIDGVTYQEAGTHGPFLYSGDTGNPKSRVQWSNTFARQSWSMTATLNYISSFGITDPAAIATGGGDQGTCIGSLTNNNGAATTDFANQIANGVVPPSVGCTVKHFTTLDLYGRFDVTQHLNLHASILNATNTHAPADWVTYASPVLTTPYNPSLHQSGAVGPYFNLGVTYTF